MKKGRKTAEQRAHKAGKSIRAHALMAKKMQKHSGKNSGKSAKGLSARAAKKAGQTEDREDDEEEDEMEDEMEEADDAGEDIEEDAGEDNEAPFNSEDPDSVENEQKKITFGQKLSHVEKKVRDRAIKSVRTFLQKNQDLTTLDYLKLWKSLWYGLWMSDKPKVQQELCVEIALLMNVVSENQVDMWIGCFFEIFQNDWWKLDIHRMNKYMLMIRVQLAEVFNYIAKRNWDEDLIDNFNDVLRTVAPFCPEGKFSVGLAIHVSSLFWSELSPLLALPAKAVVDPVVEESVGETAPAGKKKKGKKSQKGKKEQEEKEEKAIEKESTSVDAPVHAMHRPDTDVILQLLEPYFECFSEVEISDAFKTQLAQKVFTNMPDSVDKKVISEKLFQIGSKNETKPSVRKQIYAICERLDEEIKLQQEIDAPLVLPVLRKKVNRKLKAPQNRLKRGFSIKKNDRKKRNR